MNPEELACQKIDALLQHVGWLIQDRDAFNRTAAPGVAVREFHLPVVAQDGDALAAQYRHTLKSLPAPDLIAAEIVENLESALEQFRSVAAELGDEG